MNAARKKQYDRATAPVNPSQSRCGDIPRVEYLDEKRSQKLREAEEARRLEEERKRIAELEYYYNLKPIKRQKQRTPNDNVPARRKLSAANIAVPYVSPAKKNVKKVAVKQAQKRLIFSETASAEKAVQKSVILTRPKRAASTILSILAIFLMLSCILIKQAEISNQTYLNSRTEKEINALNIELSKLNMERALKEDLTGVQYSAASKGMGRPVDSQVVFVSINPLPQENASGTTEADGVTGDGDGKTTSDNSSVKTTTGLNGADQISEFFQQSRETVKGWLN